MLGIHTRIGSGAFSQTKVQGGLPKQPLQPKPDPVPRFAASAEVKDYLDLNGQGTEYDGVVILDGRRTAFGDFAGALSKMNETDLAVEATKGLLQATGVRPDQIRDSIWGNVIPSSRDAAVLSRDVTLRVGSPVGTVATNVNKLCGSGLKAIDMAAIKIANMKDTSKDFIILAGGSESMSNAPFSSFNLIPKLMEIKTTAAKMQKSGPVGQAMALKYYKQEMGKIKHAFAEDLERLVEEKRPSSEMQFMNTLREGLTHRLIDDAMLDTAENLRERYMIEAKDLDRYSMESNHRNALARAQGRYADEIVPTSDGLGGLVSQDELHRNPKAQGTNVNMNSLERLRQRKFSQYHIHPEKAVHTPANASRIVDGAAAVLLTNEETAERLGKKPLGILKATGEAAGNPHTMGQGAAQAAKVALKTAGMHLKDIDLIEVNEAFAGVALATIQDLALTYNMDPNAIRQKTNVNGGAIALGHPLGATGARLPITMLKELKRQGLEYGLVTACIGGGQGIAAIVQNPDHPNAKNKAMPLLKAMIPFTT